MNNSTRENILHILSHIEEELMEIKKLMSDNDEEETMPENNFDWYKALKTKFNIDSNGVDVIKYNFFERFNDKVLYHIKEEQFPPNGSPITVVLRFLKVNKDYNRSRGKAYAIQTLLLEHNGFKFGTLPEGVEDMQQGWFKEIMEFREVYRDKIIFYKNESFDWHNALTDRFEINLEGIKPGFGVNVETVRQSNKHILNYLDQHKNLDLPMNGDPINFVLRFWYADSSYNRSKGKIYAIQTLLLEHHGFKFGTLPEGVEDTKKKWFQNIMFSREIYRDRIIYY